MPVPIKAQKPQKNVFKKCYRGQPLQGALTCGELAMSSCCPTLCPGWKDRKSPEAHSWDLLNVCVWYLFCSTAQRKWETLCCVRMYNSFSPAASHGIIIERKNKVWWCICILQNFRSKPLHWFLTRCNANEWANNCLLSFFYQWGCPNWYSATTNNSSNVLLAWKIASPGSNLAKFRHLVHLQHILIGQNWCWHTSVPHPACQQSTQPLPLLECHS